MDITYVPFYHTYILYDPKDIISVACVQFSLFPIYVMVFYTSWFLVTREIQPVITVAGHLVGEVLNKVMKHLLKLPRPEFHKNFGGRRSLSYGMPSAHSQFMGFFATYFICVVLLQVPMARYKKAIACLALPAASICVAFSRVYLSYHTAPQVVVGLCIGVVSGLVYFVALSLARDIGLVDWVLRWKVVNYFSVKDSYFHCYKLFREEYLEVEASKTRQDSK